MQYCAQRDERPQMSLLHVGHSVLSPKIPIAYSRMLHFGHSVHLKVESSKMWDRNRQTPVPQIDTGKVQFTTTSRTYICDDDQERWTRVGRV